MNTNSITQLFEDDRAFSDAMGYFLQFSMVIVTIAVIYSSGVGYLYEVQYTHRADAAESTMEIFADDAEDVIEGGVPSRGMEMKLSESTVMVTNGMEMEVTVLNLDTGDSTTHTVDSQVYQYRTSTKLILRIPITVFTYENGALIRSVNYESVMVDKPPFRFSPNHVQMMLVDMSGQDAVAGGGAVNTVLYNEGSSIQQHTETTGQDLQVTIRLETSEKRADAWVRYFEKQGLSDTGNTDVEEGIVEYEYQTSEILIQETDTRAEIEQ